MNEWIVFGAAVLFRLLECWKKVGKLDLLKILKEFCSIS